MRKILVAALVLLLPAVMNADRLIRIPAETDSDFTSVQAMGYDVTSGSRADGYVDIMVEDRFVEETLVRYPQGRLLPIEWSQLLPRDDRNEFGFYHGPNENNAFWATLAAENDMVDTPVTFGTSYEGRDLYYVRITNASPSAPAILLPRCSTEGSPGATPRLSTSPTGWQPSTEATPWQPSY